MNILIAAPVRNRSWILPRYLKALEELDYPKEKIAFHFVLNDCIDTSISILAVWKMENEKKYRYIRLSNITFGNPADCGETGNGRTEIVAAKRNKYTYPALSIARNLILDLARLDEEIDYLLSVDTDIIVKPDILIKLISKKKDIIAALVNNGSEVYNFIPFEGKRSYVASDVFEAKTTGAVIFIKRKVFENRNIRYTEEYGTGEDAGFCATARNYGHLSFVLPDFQEHVMRRNE